MGCTPIRRRLLEMQEQMVEIVGVAAVPVTFDMPLRAASVLISNSYPLFLWDDGVVTWKETRE